MSTYAPLCWPECFALNTVDFLDEPVESVLASQLCAWGNVFMGVPIPNNFFEVMDAASKVTQVYTPEDCKMRFEKILAARRNTRSNRGHGFGHNEDED